MREDGHGQPELRRSAQMRSRAAAITRAGGLAEALASGDLPARLRLTLSEALVLGLLRQGVRSWFVVFGHGSTDLGEVLRVYAEERALVVINCRNEVAMAHAATARAWQYGETPAVLTSIGPGALQAMAGSLTAASNGVGVYHVYGDETTRGEGYNMQQIPKEEQHLYGRMTALMGRSYVLHTPEALRECLRRGSLCVGHPYRAGPFFVLAPINTQPQEAEFNLATLPARAVWPRVAPSEPDPYTEAASALARVERVVIKAGGGAREHVGAIRALCDRLHAPVILSPGSLGVLPDAHPLNMHVGGAKGSISGNFAMEGAELVVFIGSRGVCQADCSGIGYPKAREVVNINGDLADVTHYANTHALPGDITAVVERLIEALPEAAAAQDLRARWAAECGEQKRRWAAFKAERVAQPPLFDPRFGMEVATQPAAIDAVAQFARRIGAARFFDAGDVQANGFQIVEDDDVGDTFTDAGASFMGFAVSALLAAARLPRPRYAIAFTGDGSFMMNPQILIDAVAHGVRGMIALFDNRRMAAITGLQLAQYGREFATSDEVNVDYAALAGAVSGVKALRAGPRREDIEAALAEAHAHDGLSLVHIPVYSGADPRAQMGAYGAWNVGSWVEEVQARQLDQSI